MIILIGGIKGGCGKTTLAVNLACYFSSKGYETLLVDADDQQTATDFTDVRNKNHTDLPTYTQIKLSEESVLTEVKKIKKHYEYIIIDTGGRDTSSQRAALAVSDIAIIPFNPRVFDIWTMGKMVSLAEEMRPFNPKLELYACLNKADPTGAYNQEAIDIINEQGNFKFIPYTLVHRKSYAISSAGGLSILELSPRDYKAYVEFKKFSEYIENIKNYQIPLEEE